MWDSERFGLAVTWESGKKVDIHEPRFKPEGFAAFQSDALALWEEAMHHFPWQPPTEIGSDKLELFNFIERPSHDENT